MVYAYVIGELSLWNPLITSEEEEHMTFLKLLNRYERGQESENP